MSIPALSIRLHCKGRCKASWMAHPSQVVENGHMQKITPCLWFDNQAQEAVNFYTSVFKNSRIKSIARYGEGGRGTVGGIMGIWFELEGQEFMAINGGPVFTFNEAISLAVNCENQQELDQMWEKLSEGGQLLQCGWLKDKYGIAWQIVPSILADLINEKDLKKSEQVMQSLLQMTKLDIAALQHAYNRQ